MSALSTRIAKPAEVLWNAETAEPLGQLDRLVYRSNLLGRDRSVANFGGGNTSVKIEEEDHTGLTRRILYVKGSGSDLATITKEGFTGLKLEEVDLLFARDSMTDEEMVAYLSRCQLGPNMPRSSIETLLHAFVPSDHVDHTHPDATNMICCAENGEQLAKELFGDEAVWIPYIRPGFALSKQVGEAVRADRGVKFILLAKHGLVTWGDTGEESYLRTIEAVNKAVDFVNEKTGDREAFGGPVRMPLDAGERRSLLASALPVLRGEASNELSKVAVVDASPEVMQFVCGLDSRELSQVGAACPDHLVHTKMRPLWVDFDPATDGPAVLEHRLVDGVRAYRDWYEGYFERNRMNDETIGDPNPRVVLIAGVGMVALGANPKQARLSRDLYHRAVEVMRGADALDAFVSLTEEESFAVEYWPLELYKLSLAPPPKELAGKVALVTGGAGGIGRAIVRRLNAEGACVVVADIDHDGARRVADGLGDEAVAVAVDVTDERAVADAYTEATLAFGGVDIVVSNAGLASSAAVEETSLELWERDHSVLARGYFLVAREAFRLMKRQGTGGSIVFVASKNAMVAGRNAAAYSSAKAAELHLARCLAEEGGPNGLRVNTVNPDAVLQGSKIWEGSWREERARAYGIDPDDLEEYYRQRTTLKVNVYAEDVAEAVLHFASDARSPKSTGNLLNVDGGVAAAYPR
jgi:rhamnulose-1-phosphate aldolase/alcohol dehydrogenase